MKEKLGLGFLALVGLVVLITGFGLLMAYPTMWLVNYLFNSAFLATVFNTGHFTVWNAWALNILTGLLFSKTSTSSKD